MKSQFVTWASSSSLVVFLLFPFFGNFLQHPIPFSQDDPLTLTLEDPELTILQFTDLHLTFGIDAFDQKTFEMIKTLTLAEKPDLVVFTGDLTMSPFSLLLYPMLANHMETLNTPWTFIFGNHDSDFFSNEAHLPGLEKYSQLYFQVGANMNDGSVGNFSIQVMHDEEVLYHLYFLDSKAEVGHQLFTYDSLSLAQVQWYENRVKEDTVPSLAFMHIPLQEMASWSTETLIDGEMQESQVNAQGTNTGFFDVAARYGKTKGIFFGHDHLANFSFMKENILLAYGQTSGYNGYGQNPRGGRLIHLHEGILASQLIFHHDYENQ